MKYIAKGRAFGMDCQGDAMDSAEQAQCSLIGFVALSFQLYPSQALDLLQAGGPIEVGSLEPLPLIEVEEIGSATIYHLFLQTSSLSYAACCKAWGREMAQACWD